MDDSTQANGPEVIDPEEVLELALRHAREQREEFLLWMSVQVLMTDSVATADEVLQDRLCVVQDRVESMMRSRYGMTDRDAPREVTGE
jgi:hypothetical protein